MNLSTALALLDIVTDETPYADDNAHDALEYLVRGDDKLYGVELRREGTDCPSMVDIKDVTPAVLMAWGEMLDDMARIAREASADLQDARACLERVVHYFDDRES